MGKLKGDAVEWGKRRAEWTEKEEPAHDRRLPGGEESPVAPGEGSMPAPPPEHDEGP